MTDTQQRLWDAIRTESRAGWFSTGRIAALARASEVYARRFISALMDAGYLDRDPRGPVYQLSRDTGPAAPRMIKRGQEIVGVWDPNTDPTMDPGEVRAVRRSTGLSLAAFAEALGWARSSAIHVRRMETGTKPIAPDTARKIREIRDRHGTIAPDHP